MPLHDWTEQQIMPLWENLHDCWLYHLFAAIRPQLPDGYRVYLGSYSRIGLASAVRPDIGVAQPSEPPTPVTGATYILDPDEETTVATIEPWKTVYVQYRGMMVAAVEVISPRNKDRPSTRVESAARYAGYLQGGIHLLLIDLINRPIGFSFADAVEADIRYPNPVSLTPPFAAVYRVGEPTNPGSMVAVWRRTMVVGSPLPTLPIPLTVHNAVAIDLDATYMRAAADSYLT